VRREGEDGGREGEDGGRECGGNIGKLEKKKKKRLRNVTPKEKSK